MNCVGSSRSSGAWPRRTATCEARIRTASRALRRGFSAPRYRRLYRAWTADGDRALGALCSPVLADAITRQKGRIECELLAAPVPSSLSPGRHGMTSRQPADGGANSFAGERLPWCEGHRAQSDGRGTPMIARVGTRMSNAVRQIAPGTAPQRGGVLCRPQSHDRCERGVESGRERPPKRARDFRRPAAPEGRSRPDSQPGSSRKFWPSSRPTQCPSWLPTWRVRRAGTNRHPQDRDTTRRAFGRNEPWR